MLAHWHTAQFIKRLMAPTIIALEVQRVFLETWNKVYWK